MFDTSLIKTQKKWPKFIRNSPATKQKTIEKSFSKIGLNDGSAPINLTVDVWTPGKKRKNGKKGTSTVKKLSKLSVVFSTHPWDIATMSMRGISSCQRWSAGNYRDKLVGSMVDPYAGIIYITDNKGGGRGRRMLARAVVRLVIASNGGKPSIFIERVYVNSKVRIEGALASEARTQFETFVRARIANSVPIVGFSTRHTIPISKAVSGLKEHYRSYRDSHIQYDKGSKVFEKHLDQIAKTLDDV